MGPTRNVEAQRRNFRATGTRALEAQPAYLKGGTLRDYQLDGLNWMVYSWYSRAPHLVVASEFQAPVAACALLCNQFFDEQQLEWCSLVSRCSEGAWKWQESGLRGA